MARFLVPGGGWVHPRIKRLGMHHRVVKARQFVPPALIQNQHRLSYLG